MSREIFGRLRQMLMEQLDLSRELSDTMSLCKIAQFENLVRIWDFPQILEKTVKMTLPFHVSTEISPAYVEQLMWSELGDYVRELIRKEKQ